MSTAKVTVVSAVIAIISLGLVGASVIATHIDATATPAAISSTGGVGAGTIAQPADPVGDGADGRSAPAAVSGKADGSTPVDGLKLTLAVEKPQALVMPTGVKTEPIRLKITFANVSKRLITLGVGKGKWAGELDMTALGADGKAKVQIGRTVNHSLSEDGKAFLTIKPGGTFACKHEVSPQNVEDMTAAGAGVERGRYRFKFTYNYPAKIGDWPAEQKAGRWVGTASSNPVELTLAPGGANVGAKAKRVFVKVVNASKRPLEGRKQAEAWIEAETAAWGYPLAYNTLLARWRQISCTKRNVYSSMGGGRVVWARIIPGGKKDEVRVKVTGFKVLAPVTLPCRAGERRIVQLTQYDSDTNLFLVISIGAALDTETKPAAPKTDKISHR